MQFAIGDTVIIKGVGQSDSNRLEVKITNESGEEIDIVTHSYNI